MQLDHIAIGSGNVTELFSELKAQGYVPRFEVENISNPLIKKQFMDQWSDTQSLYFLDRPESISLEIVHHEYSAPDVHKLKVRDYEIEITTEDIASSAAFWQSLGFVSHIHNTLQSRFVLPPREVSIVLKEVDKAEIVWLDSAGVNCIALVTTSLQSDRERLQMEGYQVTEIQQLSLPHRILHICFVRGPQGELVELLQPVK